MFKVSNGARRLVTNINDMVQKNQNKIAVSDISGNYTYQGQG